MLEILDYLLCLLLIACAQLQVSYILDQELLLAMSHRRDACGAIQLIQVVHGYGVYPPGIRYRGILYILIVNI